MIIHTSVCSVYLFIMLAIFMRAVFSPFFAICEKSLLEVKIKLKLTFESSKVIHTLKTAEHCKTPVSLPLALAEGLEWYLDCRHRHHCFDLPATNHACQSITQAWPRSIYVILLLRQFSCRSSNSSSLSSSRHGLAPGHAGTLPMDR